MITKKSWTRKKKKKKGACYLVEIEEKSDRKLSFIIFKNSFFESSTLSYRKNSPYGTDPRVDVRMPLYPGVTVGVPRLAGLVRASLLALETDDVECQVPGRRAGRRVVGRRWSWRVLLLVLRFILVLGSLGGLTIGYRGNKDKKIKINNNKWFLNWGDTSWRQWIPNNSRISKMLAITPQKPVV